MSRVMKPWFHPDIIFALTPMGRKHAKNLKILHKLTEKVSKNLELEL